MSGETANSIFGYLMIMRKRRMVLNGEEPGHGTRFPRGIVDAGG
jgi:hypothetical protein